MKAARITIGGALAIVAFAALCFAGLGKPSVLWAQFFYTSAIATLLIISIGAVVAKHRSILIGAAILGWGYWICVFAPWFQDEVRPWLLSTRLIDEAFLRLIAPGIVDKNGPLADQFLSSTEGWRREAVFQQFSIIGQGIATLIHALQGAIVGWLFDRQRRRSVSQ